MNNQDTNFRAEADPSTPQAACQCGCNCDCGPQCECGETAPCKSACSCA
jgi:hypothetical protein